MNINIHYYRYGDIQCHRYQVCMCVLYKNIERTIAYMYLIAIKGPMVLCVNLLHLPYDWLPIDCLLTFRPPMCGVAVGTGPGGAMWPLLGRGARGPQKAQHIGGDVNRQSIGNQSSGIGNE